MQTDALIWDVVSSGEVSTAILVTQKVTSQGTMDCQRDGAVSGYNPASMCHTPA